MCVCAQTQRAVANRVCIEISPAWAASTIHNSTVQTLEEKKKNHTPYFVFDFLQAEPPVVRWTEPCQTLRLGGPSTVLITAGSSRSCPLAPCFPLPWDFSLRPAGVRGSSSTLGLTAGEGSCGDGRRGDEDSFPSINRRSTGSASGPSAFRSAEVERIKHYIKKNLHHSQFWKKSASNFYINNWTSNWCIMVPTHF